MSKELEAFSKERQALDELYDVAGNIQNLKEDYIILKTALNRLEAIDNANPSEALKDLERIGNDYFLGSKDCLVKKIYKKEYNTIKQALLNQQEQEKFFDDKLVFKNGCIMSGFDYKGKQIVAMPLEEYDEFMKQKKALDFIKKFIWVEDGKLKCGRRDSFVIELYEPDFETKEEFNLLKEVKE